MTAHKRLDVDRTWWKEAQPTDDDNELNMVCTFTNGHRAKNFATVLQRMAEVTAQDGRNIDNVLIQGSGNHLRLVSSDGFALGVVEINLGMDERLQGLGAFSKPALFSRKDIEAVARTLKKSRVRDDSTLYLTRNSEGRRVLTVDVPSQPAVTAIEQLGDYPDWQILVPGDVGIKPFAIASRYLSWAGRLFESLHVEARFMYGEAVQPVLIEGYGQNCRGLAVIMPMYIGMDSYA